MGSHPACKELGSHHSVLTKNKKSNKLKNQQFFLDLSENGGHRKKCYSQSWREIDTENNNLEQKSESINFHGNQGWCKKSSTIIVELLETQCKQVISQEPMPALRCLHFLYLHPFLPSEGSMQYAFCQYLLFVPGASMTTASPCLLSHISISYSCSLCLTRGLQSLCHSLVTC